MDLAVIIITVFFLGVFVGSKPTKDKIVNYFVSPSRGEFNFDWFGRQFLSLFSNKMANRWYEARTHLNCNFIISVLVTLHIINVGRVMFELNEEYNRYESIIVVTHGFQSRKSLVKNIDNLIFKAKKHTTSDCYYYQTFISGYNVVHDFMCH